METHNFPITEEEKWKLDIVEDELRARPVLQRTSDFLRGNRWAVLTACALAALTGYCLAVVTAKRF